MSTGSQQVVVLGGGVIGLTTAIRLVEAGHAVEVWAAEPWQQTTSVVAGALWGPSFQHPLDRTLAWTRTSLRVYQELAVAAETGVRMTRTMGVGDLPDAAEMPPQVALIPELRGCPQEEVPAGFDAGFYGVLPAVDMPTYLAYLQARLTDAGVRVQSRRASLADAVATCPVVVNCTGLAARELVGDHSVRPVRGQHVVLTNPGVEGAFIELADAAEWTSYIAHPGRIVCGGSSTPDSWDLAVDAALTERIVSRCRQVEPRLADAKLVETLVGLRPDRPQIRVEAERVDGATLVHNYGHGGNGVSLSWGCAEEVAELVADHG